MRYLKLSIVAAAILGSVSAQEGVKFGLRVSPGIGFFGVDSGGRTVKNLSASGVFGFGGGLMLSFGFSDNVALLLGAGVGTGGGKIEFKPNYAIIGSNDTLSLSEAGLTSAQQVTYKITTLNVPVFIKMRTNPIASTPLRAKGMLGGQLDIRVGSTTNSDRPVVSADFIDQDRTRTGAHFGTFLAQASAGAGVDIDIEGVGTVDVTFLYNHGLINFFDKDFKFDATVGSTTYRELKPYRDLKGRLSSLQMQIVFWF
ncbi:MAG: outer membrane beta-barrel protein [Bacteroidia bacterium]|nr:outer membrane beta-barrel protein [Bacteroidia bacterium]MCX7651259.1 outer membrane beta-barrel protein [Bacteroidia bacterium]MDW8416207.1 outer membrane beta-barrel protein [Bacteroidia bacterium]